MSEKKRTVKPVDIAKIDFSPFGEHRRLTNVPDFFHKENYTCWIDFKKFLSGDWMMGYVEAGLLPEKSVTMEKHKRDCSLMICGEYPMVLPLAPAGDPLREDEDPDADAVTAVIMYPGDVALLKAGVWHDACYGIEHPIHYHFMSKVYDTDIIVHELKPSAVYYEL